MRAVGPLALLLIALASPGAALAAEPPQILELGGVARLEVRHDPAAQTVVIRVFPSGPTGPLLVEPALVVGDGRRIPLARGEGNEQVWAAKDASLGVAPLGAMLETKVDARSFRLALGGTALPRAPGAPPGPGAPAGAERPPPTRPSPRTPPPEPPAPVRIGPEGGRLLPLGTGAVQVEVIRDVAAGRITLQIRDRKDGSAVPVAFPPVAFVLRRDGTAERVEFEKAEQRPMDRAARWTAVAPDFRETVVQAMLKVRVADATHDVNLGTIDVRSLDPPVEERVTRHGGRLSVFGEGAFHGEVIHDSAAGTVSIWFLDGSDKTPIPLNDAPVVEVRRGSEVVALTFEPVRDHLKEPLKSTGRTDLWRATHDVFRVTPLRGRVVAYVADRPYSAPLSPTIGRRGGRIVTLPDGVRVELVRDRTVGSAVVYVLDSPTPDAVFAAPPTLPVTRDGRPVDLALVPLEGRPGAYRVVHESLRGESSSRVRLRVGERTFEEQLDAETGTPAPGTPADQDAIPGDHDPSSRRDEPNAPPPATPSDEDAIPGDTDPGSKGSEPTPSR